MHACVLGMCVFTHNQSPHKILTALTTPGVLACVCTSTLVCSKTHMSLSLLVCPCHPCPQAVNAIYTDRKQRAVDRLLAAYVQVGMGMCACSFAVTAWCSAVGAPIPACCVYL